MKEKESESFPKKIFPDLKSQVTEMFTTRVQMFLSSKIKLWSILDVIAQSSKEYESYYWSFQKHSSKQLKVRDNWKPKGMLALPKEFPTPVSYK